MRHEEFIKLCIKKVEENENKRQDMEVITNASDVFVVWSCKTLQNSKALLSTLHKGACYYEFTLNGDKDEIYMDAYTKVLHEVISNR